MELWIALAIFFGFPLLFVVYTGWLIVTGRTKGEAEIYQPMGDAIETPTVLHQTRRSNHARR